MEVHSFLPQSEKISEVPKLKFKFISDAIYDYNYFIVNEDCSNQFAHKLNEFGEVPQATYEIIKKTLDIYNNLEVVELFSGCDFIYDIELKNIDYDENLEILFMFKIGVNLKAEWDNFEKKYFFRDINKNNFIAFPNKIIMNNNKESIMIKTKDGTKMDLKNVTIEYKIGFSKYRVISLGGTFTMIYLPSKLCWYNYKTNMLHNNNTIGFNPDDPYIDFTPQFNRFSGNTKENINKELVLEDGEIVYDITSVYDLKINIRL